MTALEPTSIVGSSAVDLLGTVETPAVRRYHVGTLTYTPQTLSKVFFWMLWGDLCLNVMESVIPRLVPLQLQQLGASNAVIGILTGTIFSIMNWVMNPIISTSSDRYRSRLGRRMPFMLWPSFFLAGGLIAIGFAEPIGETLARFSPWLADCVRWASSHLPGVWHLSASAQLTIGIFALTLIAYRFFDLFPQSVYYCLFVDVIPQPFIGRFVCAFRIVATLGIVLFHYFLLQYATSHTRLIYLGCAGLYLVAFVLLSLMVKEGSYPPPPQRQSGRFSFASLTRWFAQSFGTAFYWKFFFPFAIARWIYVPFNTFLILYAQQKVGMSAAQFGHVIALMLLIQIPTLLGLGPLLDRFHPTRMAIVAYAIMAATALGGFLLIHGEPSFIVATSVLFFALAVLQGTMSTLAPRILPRAQFGQFSAATAMVTEGGMAVLAWLCGAMLDKFGQAYLYLWAAGFAGFGLIWSVVLFRAWMKRGGDVGYVPPDVELAFS